jgi:hypothetical protein
MDAAPACLHLVDSLLLHLATRCCCCVVMPRLPARLRLLLVHSTLSPSPYVHGSMRSRIQWNERPGLGLDLYACACCCGTHARGGCPPTLLSACMRGPLCPRIPPPHAPSSRACSWYICNINIGCNIHLKQTKHL